MDQKYSIPSMSYLALVDAQTSPGVYKKVKGMVEGAIQSGWKATYQIIDPNPGFIPVFVEKIDQVNSDILIVRSICQYNFYLVPAFLRASKRGVKLVLDVPTPNKVAISELWRSNLSWTRKLKDLAFLIGSGPVPYWPVSRVLQYAQEGTWFRLGNQSKTLDVGNGISVESIPMRKVRPEFDGKILRLICVANLNYWHGTDRLIQAMYDLKKRQVGPRIELKIVGKGAVYASLIEMVNKLELSNQIEFMGFLDGDQLYRQYETAHLAVGSLALFRKNLRSASELKSREYCAVGVPFISVGEDFDFSEKATFRAQLPNRESVEDLVMFFENFDEAILKFSPLEIRRYAKENLDFSYKFKQLVNSLKVE